MKKALFVSLAVLTICAPGRGLAQDRARPVDLNRRVFIDVNQAAPFDVLVQISSVIGSYLDPNTAVAAAPVTMRVWNIRARTAMDVLCDTIGCRWQMQGRTLIVSQGPPPPPPPHSAEFFARLRKPLEGFQWTFVRTPLRDAIDALSKVIDGRIVLEGADPNTPVTVSLMGVTPYRALFDIMAAIGCSEHMVGWEGVDDGKGPILLRGRCGPGPKRETKPAPAEQVYEKDEPGLTLPRPLSTRHPEYTRDAMRQKVQGTVVLTAVVGADGTVRDVRVQTSLRPDLDAQAIKAIELWRFTPGSKDGKPVPVRVTLEMSFALR